MVKFLKKVVWKFLPKILRNVLGLRNIILFKAHPNFSGNTYALYEYLQKNRYDKKYKMIWIGSGREEKVPQNAIHYNERKFKHRYYYKFCAKFVFYEEDCPINGRMRGQRVIYLSHGCPTLKNSTGRIDVSAHKTTDALITSENVRRVMSKIRQFPQENMFVCGHPRNDVIFNNFLTYEKMFTQQYHKFILWLPTFRKMRVYSNSIEVTDSSCEYLYGLPLIRHREELEKLNCLLKDKSIMLIIKPHPNALKEGIDEINYSNISVWTQNYLDERNINLYRLFKNTDAFISDYSSVIFDAMLADKPLAYVIDDIDDYKLGYAYDNVLDYMPGHHIKTLEDMILFFEDVSQNKDIYRDERRRVNAWANEYPDGNNCKRIIEMFGL